MIAPMYAELSRRIRICPSFDIFDMGPVDSNRDIVLGLAGNGASMAPDASLVVNHESVVSHYLCDEAPTQNCSVSTKEHSKNGTTCKPSTNHRTQIAHCSDHQNLSDTVLPEQGNLVEDQEVLGILSSGR